MADIERLAPCCEEVAAELEADNASQGVEIARLEAEVIRLREAVEWAQLRGVAMNDAGLVVRMNYALNPQEADHE